MSEATSPETQRRLMDSHAELLAIHAAVMNPQAAIDVDGDPYTLKRVKEFLRLALRNTRSTVRIKLRPMLVNGMLSSDAAGPVVLIDSEQPEGEQVVSLWHEIMHLLGLTDEKEVEAIAYNLAEADPHILRKLAKVINVADSAAPTTK
jgi:hypothetical protein